MAEMSAQEIAVTKNMMASAGASPAEVNEVENLLSAGRTDDALSIVDSVLARAGDSREAQALQDFTDPFRTAPSGAEEPQRTRDIVGSFRDASPPPTSSGGSSGGASSPAGGAAGPGGGGVGGASDLDIAEQIKERYPQFSWLTQHSEVMDLFTRSLAEGTWSESKFLLELQQTGWWQSTSASVREWERLRSTDPATAERRLLQQRALMTDQALRLGVDLDPSVLASLAENALRFGWSADEIGDALVNHVDFADPGFGIAAGARQRVRGMMNDYAVLLGEEEQQRWARRLLTGEATPESMQAYFVEQASSMYPSAANELAGGTTVRQYADPYIQLASRELEISPGSVDLTDPKWSRPLLQKDESGQWAQMSLYDWGRTLRSDRQYGYHKTKRAGDAADALGLTLARTFGGVA